VKGTGHQRPYPQRLIRSARCLGERGFALLPSVENSPARHASPGKVSKIAQPALVLVLFEVGGWLQIRDQLAGPAGLVS
jgi:hypothetical protein